MAILRSSAALTREEAQTFIENVVAVMPYPMGIATNFCINGHDHLIPMVTEEPSVVAGASHAAKLARPRGGFQVDVMRSLMIGQIVLVGIPDIQKTCTLLEKHKEELLALANEKDPLLCSLGGGARDIKLREVQTKRGAMLALHLIVDVKDVMGANVVNTMAEAIAPKIEQLCGGRARLKIVSNLSTKRMVKAQATWNKDVIGFDTIEGILDAQAFACADQWRATTHNKGIMNGIDAVALATGNDVRALEAGAHSFAARSGSYQPLTHYEKNNQGDLTGYLEIPLSVGILGGMTTAHPTSRVALKLLGVSNACDLAAIMGAVGLAQNFAALRALVTEGIQKGHMRLHARKEKT